LGGPLDEGNVLEKGHFRQGAANRKPLHRRKIVSGDKAATDYFGK
jgi:hypothetical protein